MLLPKRGLRFVHLLHNPVCNFQFLGHGFSHAGKDSFLGLRATFGGSGELLVTGSAWIDVCREKRKSTAAGILSESGVACCTLHWVSVVCVGRDKIGIVPVFSSSDGGFHRQALRFSGYVQIGSGKVCVLDLKL